MNFYMIMLLQGEPGKDGSAGNPGPSGGTVSHQNFFALFLIFFS